MGTKKILLFIDATMRPAEISQTSKLCEVYLTSFLSAHPDYTLVRRILKNEDLLPCTFDEIESREQSAKNGECESKELAYAVEFANADSVLIGAPYWDLSFPALLKVYIEKVCIAGITFMYKADGVKSLCKANSMTYLTSAGGEMLPGFNFGADYLRALCKTVFGIDRFQTEFADLLDVVGVDSKEQMRAACERIELLIKGDSDI